MSNSTTHWTIPEALAATYDTFGARFGHEALFAGFEALTRHPKETLLEGRRLSRELGPYISRALNVTGKEQIEWLSRALAAPDQDRLLLHAGVRWWLARDGMLRMPAGTLLRKESFGGRPEHFSLQLLGEMLQGRYASGSTGR